MYKYFTDHSRKVLQLAKGEAEAAKQSEIDTEHLLLALAKENYGIAAHVLMDLGADLPRIRDELKKLASANSDSTFAEPAVESERLKQVLGYSLQEARALSHNYVGTEHLLLALVKDEDGQSAQVLRNLELTAAEVRREVLNILGHDLDPHE